jgi:hypothetical protein
MIDLDYSDPYAPQLVADPIVTSGRRLRRRRRIIGGGGAFAVLAAVVCVAIIVPHDPRPATSAAPFDPAPGQHRPSDPVVIVGTPIPNWHAYVYQSLGGGVCIGAAAYSGSDKGFVSGTCDSVDHGSVIDPGVWVQQPLFQGAPVGDGRHVLVIGLVRGPATTVTLDFMGQRASAPVVPVPEPGWDGLGAYAMWLPTHGAQAYGSDDITDIEARDAHGHLVARLP